MYMTTTTNLNPSSVHPDKFYSYRGALEDNAEIEQSSKNTPATTLHGPAVFRKFLTILKVPNRPKAMKLTSPMSRNVIEFLV